MTRAGFLRHLGGTMAGLVAGGSALDLIAETAAGPNVLMPSGAGKPPVGEYEMNANFINRGPGFGRRISLTFDDGPSPGVTERVLKELEKRDIKATFFMIGKRVDESPALAREVLAAGHEIGNHSFTHPQLGKMSDDKVIEEIEKCQDAIKRATNIQPVWFRPPYGSFRKEQGHMAVKRGLGVAYWTVDPRDWAQPGAGKITASILRDTRPGYVVLMHDLHKQTADALPQILDGLMEREFEFARMSDFLGGPYDNLA